MEYIGCRQTVSADEYLERVMLLDACAVGVKALNTRRVSCGFNTVISRCCCQIVVRTNTSLERERDYGATDLL